MTTTVKIEAHCSDDKEVSVSINSVQSGENHKLQDGEAGEYIVYDDREITVKEVLKE